MKKKTNRTKRFWEWVINLPIVIHVIAFAVLVIISFLALSLSALKDGYVILSGKEEWVCWAMAVGIDLGIVSSEVAWIVANVKNITGVKKTAIPAFFILCVFSAWLNIESNVVNLESVEKWHQSVDWWKACMLGLFTPLAVALICKYTAGLAIFAGTVKKPKSKPKRVIKKKAVQKPKMSNKERRVSESEYINSGENDRDTWVAEEMNSLLGMSPEEISALTNQPLALVKRHLETGKSEIEQSPTL